MKPLVRVILALGLGVTTIVWQLKLSLAPAPNREKSEELSASMGICMRDTERFFYFFYYLGLFPVTANVAPTQYSTEGARAFVREQGETLSNDLDTACMVGRGGDWGRFFVLLPHAWKTGSAENPSTKEAASWIFIASLALLCACFAYSVSIPLGVALTLFIGSSHFQLYETYHNINVFWTPVTTFVLTLALLSKFIGTRSAILSKVDWLRAVVAGLALALMSQVRLENLPLIASGLLALCCAKQPVARRLLLCVTFVGSLVTCVQVCDRYFTSKIAESAQFVTKSGGTLKTGEALAHHPFWHSIAAGLGDFDKRYGYQMSDIAIYSKVLPVLNSKFEYQFYPAEWFYGDSKDPAARIKPENVPEYAPTARDIVLSDVRRDPLWYISILGKRASLILSSFTPLRAKLLVAEYSLSVPSLLIAFCLVVVIATRHWRYLALMGMALPMSAVPFLITSTGGTTAYGVLQFVSVAILIDMTCAMLWRGVVGARVGRSASCDPC